MLVLLSGFGVTAFGIAPLAPDAAELPRRVISEVVKTDNVEQQLAALADHKLDLLRNDITRSTDTPERLLARLGVVDASAAAFLRTDPAARALFAGRGGKMVQARAADDGTLLELVARYPAEDSEKLRTHFTRMSVGRAAGSWLARVETAPLQSELRLASGTIKSSLFAATDESGLSEVIALQMAEIFATDIDFHRELRKGDTFSLVYEALTADGEVISWNDGTGRVLAAEFINAGRSHQAVWFANQGGRSGYFDLAGESKRRAFLTSPMEFSRVTSGFANRFHPILRAWRRHLGVDYGAPIGTPVRTVGDGVIEFAGRQNGYGNVVKVQHGNGRSTLYAHLSRIDVRKGQRVEQGQKVGAVGMTGWTTGPHLHFEFKIGEQHQDPVRVAQQSEAVTLDAAAKGRFAAVAQRFEAKLELAESLNGVRALAE